MLISFQTYTRNFEAAYPTFYPEKSNPPSNLYSLTRVARFHQLRAVAQRLMVMGEQPVLIPS